MQRFYRENEMSKTDNHIDYWFFIMSMIVCQIRIFYIVRNNFP